MKKNNILKIILTLIVITLTIVITGSFVKANQNYGVDQQHKHIMVKKYSNQNEVKDLISRELITKAGYARDYYEKNGELYIVFDEVEFFRGEEAKKEYFKDGNTEEPMEEWGNDYYIRNNDDSVTIYKVASDSKLQMLSFEDGRNNSIDLVTVTPDKIKEKINKYKGNKYTEAGLLFNIDQSNNVIYGMRSIFIP